MKPDLSFLPRALTPAQTTILTVWVLIMISIPIVDWSMDWSAMMRPITLGVTISALVVMALLWGDWGAVVTFRASFMILVLSWVAEAVGSHFGIPFGTYSYTDALQPQILGVPIQVPLGWLMMLPPAWAIAQAISDPVALRWRFPVFIGLSALAMMAWDLFLDPMMVTWGIWVWHHPGGFFGIPWINYLGWLLISALITIIIRPEKLSVVPLLMIYTSIWLLKSVGLGIFWDIPGPALVGFIFMGAVTVIAWRAFLAEHKKMQAADFLHNLHL